METYSGWRCRYFESEAYYKVLESHCERYDARWVKMPRGILSDKLYPRCDQFGEKFSNFTEECAVGSDKLYLREPIWGKIIEFHGGVRGRRVVEQFVWWRSTSHGGVPRGSRSNCRADTYMVLCSGGLWSFLDS